MRPTRPTVPLLLLATALAGCAPAAPDLDGPGLVRAMHERYAPHRPGSLTFVQETVHHWKGAEPDTAIWYEAALPGKLRIDYAPIEQQNGAVYNDGLLALFKEGRVVATRREVNPLQLLLMDVFQFEPDRTLTMLDTLGFDLSLFREGTWDGKPVWIVGAGESDSTSAQFWVDRDRLVAVRIVLPVGGGTRTLDVRIPGYREMEGYLQEEVLRMYLDGTLYQEEFYRQIRTGVEVDPALFDTSTWAVDRPYWE